MRLSHSILLCTGYTVYLILGAAMFMFLEYDVVEDVEVTEPPEWTRLKEVALSEELPLDRDMVEILKMWLPRACRAVPNRTLTALGSIGSQSFAVRETEAACPHIHQKNVTEVIIYTWSFIDSLYFSMTVTTTIGYGHISPTQPWGRIMCMLYSLVGIPLTGILLAWTSEFFGELMYKLFKSKVDKQQQDSKLIIALATTFYILLGFMVFIFLPAIIFTLLEEWTYLESVYYAYITLTTIGFGDFVSGKTYEGGALFAYQIGVILWIMIGLGYWVMVASFITKALKSKHLHNSMMRSAEEVKRLMQNMNGKQNTDPTFIRQQSKATLNLMLQLSNIIALEGDQGTGVATSPDGVPTSPSTTTTTGPSSPNMSPLGIPGIASLFGPGFARTTPFSSLMGPMKKENDPHEPECQVQEGEPLMEYVHTNTPPGTPKKMTSDLNQTPEDDTASTNRDPEGNIELHISESEDELENSLLQVSNSPAGSEDSETPSEETKKPRAERSDSQTPLTCGERSKL